MIFFASKVHCRVQPTASRHSGKFSKIRGALRALHVSKSKSKSNVNLYSASTAKPLMGAVYAST